uniref:MIT domain-containing protein n=1 Tax=Meloidogyne incognita TaxID=6306 RepID=A0A914NEV2_MELIC
MEINELHQLAQIAVKYDDIGDFNNAIIYYSKAANQIFKLIENKKISQKYKEISLKYLNRCEELKKHVKPASEQNDSFSFVMKALEYDEKGNYNEALNLYTEGAELGLLELKSPNTPEKIQKLKELTSLAIERAEKIKSLLNTNNQSYNNPSAPILSDDEEKVEEEINFDFLNKIFPKVPMGSL